MFDELVKKFLRSHPEGTVVEIGSGLNTRFERLDNGRLHWFDLDLPEVVELRRKFFTDTAENFPCLNIAFNTASRKAADGGNKDHARRKLDARFAWACEDPREIEGWNYRAAPGGTPHHGGRPGAFEVAPFIAAADSHSRFSQSVSEDVPAQPVRRAVGLLSAQH